MTALPVSAGSPAHPFLEQIFLSPLLLRAGCFVAHNDQVTTEERTEPATSGGSRPLQLRFPNCIERAPKNLQ
jgi:hypothetical protein